MIRNIFILFCFSILLFSCNDKEYPKIIIGGWQCVDWTVNNRAGVSSSEDVSFKFNTDGTYIYQNSGLKEDGTYKIEGDNLYTTPNGQLEMMVEIEKLNADSLVFNMSRGGTPERMTLKRVK